MRDITNNMKNLSLDKRTFFLELTALLTILIKSPAANAVSESFSESSSPRLMFVKIWLRTSMSQERLKVELPPSKKIALFASLKALKSSFCFPDI